jgi:hypothetical protein
MLVDVVAADHQARMLQQHLSDLGQLLAGIGLAGGVAG